MADFSIAGDIAPLRGSYFSNTLTSGERSSLRGRESASVNQYMGNMMKMMEAVDRKRDRDLRYQMNVEALQAQRDQYVRQKELDDRLPAFLGQVNDIVNSDADTNTKNAALANLQMQNPYLATSKAGALVVGAANKGITSQYQAGLAQKAEAQGAATRLSPYAQVGDVEATRREAGLDGVITPEDEYMIRLAEANKKRAEETAGAAASEAERGRVLDTEKDFIEHGFSVLEGVRFVGGENGMPAVVLQGDGETTTTEPATPTVPELTPTSRRKLEYVFSRAAGLKLKDIRELGLSDDALQDKVYDLLYERRVRLERTQNPNAYNQFSGPTGAPNPIDIRIHQ